MTWAKIDFEIHNQSVMFCIGRKMVLPNASEDAHIDMGGEREMLGMCKLLMVIGQHIVLH